MFIRATNFFWTLRRPVHLSVFLLCALCLAAIGARQFYRAADRASAELRLEATNERLLSRTKDRSLFKRPDHGGRGVVTAPPLDR